MICMGTSPKGRLYWENWSSKARRTSVPTSTGILAASCSGTLPLPLPGEGQGKCRGVTEKVAGGCRSTLA